MPASPTVFPNASTHQNLPFSDDKCEHTKYSSAERMSLKRLNAASSLRPEHWESVANFISLSAQKILFQHQTKKNHHHHKQWQKSIFFQASSTPPHPKYRSH